MSRQYERTPSAGALTWREPEKERGPEVVINRQALSDDERAVFGGIPPGRYWYDKTSGLWGREGMPVEGQTLPDMNLGGALRSDASGGASGVFLNGRELPALELLSLNPPGALTQGLWWMTADGTFGPQGGATAGRLTFGATPEAGSDRLFAKLDWV